MSQPQPIKRSPQLTPLSKDHHEGLLLVWKIRQGLRNHTPLQEIGDYVNWFWQQHLAEHFREEEEIVASYLPADDPGVRRMNEEHQELEALVHINESVTDEALLEKFAGLLNDHIRFEEREFFPYIEKTVAVEKLDELFEKLTKENRSKATWKNEFWLRK